MTTLNSMLEWDRQDFRRRLVVAREGMKVSAIEKFWTWSDPQADLCETCQETNAVCTYQLPSFSEEGDQLQILGCVPCIRKLRQDPSHRCSRARDLQELSDRERVYKEKKGVISSSGSDLHILSSVIEITNSRLETDFVGSASYGTNALQVHHTLRQGYPAEKPGRSEYYPTILGLNDFEFYEWVGWFGFGWSAVVLRTYWQLDKSKLAKVAKHLCYPEDTVESIIQATEEFQREYTEFMVRSGLLEDDRISLWRKLFITDDWRPLGPLCLEFKLDPDMLKDLPSWIDQPAIFGRGFELGILKIRPQTRWRLLNVSHNLRDWFSSKPPIRYHAQRRGTGSWDKELMILQVVTLPNQSIPTEFEKCLRTHQAGELAEGQVNNPLQDIYDNGNESDLWEDRYDRQFEHQWCIQTLLRILHDIKQGKEIIGYWVSDTALNDLAKPGGDRSQDEWPENFTDPRSFFGVPNDPLQSKAELVPHTVSGTYGSVFPLVVKQCNLIVAHTHLWGAPRVWFSIYREDLGEFKRIMADIYPQWAEECPYWIEHVKVFVHPSFLTIHSIKFTISIQHVGETIITFPDSYTQSVNLGLNFIRSSPVGCNQWAKLAGSTRLCKCAHSSNNDETPYYPQAKANGNLKNLCLRIGLHVDPSWEDWKDAMEGKGKWADGSDVTGGYW